MNCNIPTRVYERVSYPTAKLTERDLPLLLIVERDHNYYDDSDTNFLYYNTEKKCIEKGIWTTRGYCGDMFYDYPSIGGASEKVKEDALPVLKEFLKRMATPTSFTSLWWYSTEVEKYGIQVCVEGGRKFQGEGVLLACHEYERNHICMSSVSILADGVVQYASPQFVRFDQQAFMDMVYSYIDGLSFSDAYRLISDTWDKRYTSVLIEVMKVILPDNDVEVPEETLQMKREKLMAWGRTKLTYDNDEELEEIIHRIMLKKYGEDI